MTHARARSSSLGAALAALALTGCFGPHAGQVHATQSRDAYASRATSVYDARILRDSFGVPHIHGKRDADVAFGVAWAQAEDDWDTLENVFLATRGRAAAKLGKRGAAADFFLAWLGVRQTVAEKGRRDIDARTWAYVEGYVAGFNAYAEAHPDEVTGVTKALLPMTPEDMVAGFVMTSPLFIGLDRLVTGLLDDVLPSGAAGHEKGSNGFAVAPARSGDGVTRLVANSHQPLTGPVAWYELTVHSEEGLNFAGALFPGSPVPLLGHNRTLGWTNTVNAPDLIDVYRLRLNPDNDTQYWYDGRWRDLEREKVWLKVKMGWFTLPVSRMIERSVHGPVLRNAHGAFAVRYAGIGQVRQVVEYLALAKARTYAEWRQALAIQGVAGTNFIYADSAGNIAMVYNASFPKRASGFDWQGVLPGDTSAALWTGYHPPEDTPAIVNPRSGYVYNANNTPFRATAADDNLDRGNFDPTMGIERKMTNRAVRAFELLDTMRVITREKLLAAKFDASYSRAGWVGALLDTIAVVDTVAEPALAEPVRMLAAWDGVMADDRPAAALAGMIIGQFGRAAYLGTAAPTVRPLLRESTAYLRQHHGRLDLPLGTVWRHRRGSADVPIRGGPDALRAVYGAVDGKGAVVGEAGDSFVMVVEWLPNGEVRSESIQPYGAAVSRPASPHYADQTTLFAGERFKPVWFTEAAQRAHLERETRVGGAATPR